MSGFEKYFSEKQIVNYLANKRAKAAKNIHDNQFLRNISRNARKPFDPEKKDEIYDLLPYRNQWLRFRKEERIKYSNSKALNAAQIERTVWRDHKRVIKGLEKEQDWHVKLFSLIDEVQKSALLKKEKVIHSPRAIPVVKSNKDKTFRCISSFDKISDQIIISQTAKYLTDVFDPIFENCSFAFRSKNSDKRFTHHLAVEEIIDFKKKYQHKRLYAAECDIAKFYDTINHSTIKERFKYLINQIRMQGKEVDARAIKLFYAYLNCYAFNTDIYPYEKDILEANNIKDGSIAWVEAKDFEKVGSDIYKDRIGVPQGGALSCLIANIVLDYADKKLASLKFRSLFYARFCDDIIIIHPQKKQCKKVNELYKNCLVDLKLIAHSPVSFIEYGADFWSIKTKEPYVWNKLNKKHRLAKKNVPWLAFVGYQIRYDGLVRVRPPSVKKELEKQVDEANKVIQNLPNTASQRIKKRNIIFRFSQRLIAMSVGRVNSDNVSMCWTKGFNVLEDNPARKWQLRKLDKNRNLQISRIKRHLKKFDAFEDDDKMQQKKKKKLRVRDFYGYPYSYYYQFIKDEIENG